jgi:chaperone required for assembly of F1-ATPase
MKRFYKQVTVAAQEGAGTDGGWRVLLDGRGIKTAAGNQQIVPSRPLAEALAREWEGQGETIDPTGFKFRDLADYAIDVISGEREEVLAALVAYAETDTLCYRADPDEPLHRRQIELWEPVVRAAEQRFDVHFTRISGIIHKPQPPATLERLRALLATHDPFTLAALRVLASLSASLTVALLAIVPDADTQALWAAASLEEEWQADLWGRDAEAEERRERRAADFASAVEFARLATAACDSPGCRAGQ